VARLRFFLGELSAGSMRRSPFLSQDFVLPNGFGVLAVAYNFAPIQRILARELVC
jgi:hypothetical protein